MASRVKDKKTNPPIPCYVEIMSQHSMLDQLLDPLALCLDRESAHRVAEFSIDPALQEKLSDWAGKANEGLLDEEQRLQYEALINAADFVSILKLKAKNSLGA